MGKQAEKEMSNIAFRGREIGNATKSGGVGISGK